MKKLPKAKDKASSITTKPGTSVSRQRSRKTFRKIRWIRHGIVFVILATVAVIIGMNAYSQYITESEHVKVTTQLNDVASDLHKVYIDLKAKLPNVIESSFKNECAMSYAGPSTKAYSCGPMLRIYIQNAIDNNVDKLRESAILRAGVFSSYLNTESGKSSSGYWYSSHQFAHSNGQICKLSAISYQDAAVLQGDTSVSGDSWTFPVEVDDIYCSKHLTYSVDLKDSWSQ